MLFPVKCSCSQLVLDALMFDKSRKSGLLLMDASKQSGVKYVLASCDKGYD